MILKNIKVFLMTTFINEKKSCFNFQVAYLTEMFVINANCASMVR